MREITDHKLSDLNNAVDITADERDSACGNASHEYAIHLHKSETEGHITLLNFQHGAVKEVGLNGISDEVLIAIVIDRLQGFQAGDFRSRENALAITQLEEAMHWLNHRTLDRMRRGVEGVSKA